MMAKPLEASAQKVQDLLKAQGYTYEVIELQDSTRTAKEAAQAVGCQLGQIVKSLVFRGGQSNQAVMVIASGVNRVNEKLIAEHASEPVVKAEADFVRQETGFAIGGVPPLGLAKGVRVFIDQDLLKYDEVWAAAGTPHAVFRLLPADLVKMTGGKVVTIC